MVVNTSLKKHPWLIAFGFGLIHGLGFAEALKDIGQLLFVSAILLFARIFKYLITKHVYIYKMGRSYMVGIISSVRLENCKASKTDSWETFVRSQKLPTTPTA